MRRRAALAAMTLALLGACAPNQPPSADATPQPVRLVFFEDDSIALGANALTVVQDAAAAAARSPMAMVRVAGFVAPEPGHAPIVALARARAEHVAAELERFGVARTRIQVQGRGAATFAADAPIEARRVEIRIGAN